jgi:hypothetical protein
VRDLVGSTTATSSFIKQGSNFQFHLRATVLFAIRCTHRVKKALSASPEFPLDGRAMTRFSSRQSTAIN